MFFSLRNSRDFYAESHASKWLSYVMEGSSWDDEWFVERAPVGYWADFFDPAWEVLQRSAKIFNDEDMPKWWENRLRAMGFLLPVIYFFALYVHRVERLVFLERIEMNFSLLLLFHQLTTRLQSIRDEAGQA